MPSMGAAGEGGQSDVGHYFLLIFAPWMATTEKTERPFLLILGVALSPGGEDW